MTTEADTVLSVEELTIRFHTHERALTAVDTISFSLRRGETLGIVGESGSGKSVTSLALMRLINQPPGEVQQKAITYTPAEGPAVDLSRISDKGIRQYRGNDIAMIFQEPMTSLNPVYTCGDQVIEAIRQHNPVSKREAREQALQLFRDVQLPRPEQMLRSYPHQLSGGQKQRVMIAMAISCNPAVLIADEPTTALDVTVQKVILDLLHKLQRLYGMSIIFITHDLGVIAEVADRVLVMYQGQVVEENSIYQLFSAPQHPYTKGLLACRPPLDQRLQQLPTMEAFMRMDEQGQAQSLDKSVGMALQEMTISAEERRKHLKRLYNRKPLLRVEDLRAYFPIRKGVFGRIVDYVRAVDEVSFDVYPGEVMGLVGESGCGKTTLGRVLLRLLDATGGSVQYRQESLLKLNQEAMRQLRKSMQIIFQDPYSSLNPRMTVGNAILEPMQVHRLYRHNRERREKVIELLERVNLSPQSFNCYPHEFSGGQRQRICIARALAVDPEFIICDESVSALDVSVQAQVLNLLTELKQEYGFTYIFISHDLSVVKYMADRIMVMKDGAIEEIGEADEVYHRPQSPYTQELIEAIPKGRLSDIEEAVAKRSQPSDAGQPSTSPD